jgi:hypothetical protein
LDTLLSNRAAGVFDGWDLFFFIDLLLELLLLNVACHSSGLC